MTRLAEPDFLTRVEGIEADAPTPPPQTNQSNIPTPEDSTVAEPEQLSRSFRLQWRFWRTLVFAAWIFVRVLFWQVYIYRVFPAYVDRTNLNRWKRYAREFRHFAVARGGVYIKLGQFISTRVDILPEEIIEELASLQDEVPTIAFRKIQGVLADELGDLDAHYEWINEEPVGSGLIRPGTPCYAQERGSRRR